MASQPRHRRTARGSLSLFLRLVTALAVALLSLPAFDLSARADEPAPEQPPEARAAQKLKADLEAADYIVVDEDGPNDEPGQKDLTQLFSFSNPPVGTVEVGWSWDEIAWSGANTGDTCALFDTDGDGKVDYAVCVTIDGNPATQVSTAADPSPRLYSCGDDKVDRCTSPNPLIASGPTSGITCDVTQTETDPFDGLAANEKGDDHPTDTSALCSIPLSLMSQGPVLVNVCSYPSQEPNSDPSDCVLIPRDSELTIKKVVTPAGAADQTDFTFSFTASEGAAPSSFSLKAGEERTIGVQSKATITVSEAVPQGWRLVSATCTGGHTIDDIVLNSTTNSVDSATCTFTNTRTASVLVNKTWVINGTTYTQGDTVPAGHAADLALSGQNDPAFGTAYSGYDIGDDVTIGEEDVSVPAGCRNRASGDIGDRTLAAGLNTYTITNTVTCDATVTVDKRWVINGVRFDDGDQPDAYSAELELTDQTDPDFGATYPGYSIGDDVTIGEDVDVPDGCENEVSGDTGEHELTAASNTFTITNTVTCGASVRVDKTWVINGTTYHQGDTVPAGYSATLVLTGEPDPSFGTVYGGYTEGGSVTVDETYAVPTGCTNVKTGHGTKTLAKGLNTFTITNTVTCPPPPPPPPSVVIDPAWALAKTSSPTSGSTVQPGQQVTYTLTATNTSFAVVDDAVVTDNLSEVLDNATLTQPLAAGLTLTGSTLTWDVPTLAVTGSLGSSATVSYTVTVGPDEWGETLRNVATPSGDGGLCPTTDGCRTVHPTPAWELTKMSDPASGSEVDPGSDITYTLTVVNTSAAVLTGALVEDDLSEVLDNASLDDDSLDGSLTLDGTTLTWAIPTLHPGEEATVSYTVTVDSDASGVVLENVVAPASGGGTCVEADDCATTHSTPEILGEEVLVPEPRPEPQPRPPATVLPATGAPLGAGTAGLLGIAGLLVGGLLVIGDGRRRRARRQP